MTPATPGGRGADPGRPLRRDAPGAGGAAPSDAQSDAHRDAERRRRRARVFGEVLPESTSDERDDWGGRAARSNDGTGSTDEWLRGQVPPHHG